MKIGYDDKDNENEAQGQEFHFPILDNDYNSDDDDYDLREIRVHVSADDDVVKPVAVDVVDSHRVAKVGANLWLWKVIIRS